MLTTEDAISLTSPTFRFAGHAPHDDPNVLAEDLLRRGRHDELLELFRTGVLPTNEQTHLARIAAQIQAGLKDEAAQSAWEAFERYFEQKDTRRASVCLAQLARLGSLEGVHDLAVELAEDAIEFAPRESMGHAVLFCALNRAGLHAARAKDAELARWVDAKFEEAAARVVRYLGDWRKDELFMHTLTNDLSTAWARNRVKAVQDLIDGTKKPEPPSPASWATKTTRRVRALNLMRTKIATQVEKVKTAVRRVAFVCLLVVGSSACAASPARACAEATEATAGAIDPSRIGLAALDPSRIGLGAIDPSRIGDAAPS